MVISPGAASSITSAVTVSTAGVVGGVAGLFLFRPTCFAAACLGIPCAKRLLGFDLAAVRLAASSRGLAGLAALAALFP
jgi:hypothetical protein